MSDIKIYPPANKRFPSLILSRKPLRISLASSSTNVGVNKTPPLTPAKVLTSPIFSSLKPFFIMWISSLIEDLA